ncbi:MAG: TerC family protein [Rhodospirillales bacterium]
METTAEFWTALLQIIGINIVLSGDNAVVIAMACRSLPPERQKWGIFLGAGAAIVLRIVFTVFIVTLLTVPYLKIVGGLLLFWIGFKLIVDSETDEKIRPAGSLWQAVRIVLVADAVMSLDNVVAVAAAAKGNYTLLILGLILSVPLVIYGATVLIKLLNRYPLIVPAGAALIGYVAGEVMITDPAVQDWVGQHVAWLHWAAPLIGAMSVVFIGRIVDPTPAKSRPEVTSSGVLGSALVFWLRSSLQFFGRLIVSKAPILVAFIASAFGYALSEQPPSNDATLDTATDVMHAVRPILAAVLAIALGEVVAWVARKFGRRTTPAVTQAKE